MKEKKLDQHHKKYTVFWDGDCAFCSRCATWVKEKTPPTVELVPYQNAPNPPIDANLASECGKALHLQLPNGNFERGGKACVSILELIGYKIIGRIFKNRFLNWIPETLYYLIARNRKILSFFFLK
tara:strand:+ start:978 stop:1355 length:378 start_codon:yes stop_codon:yes gene_type:complete